MQALIALVVQTVMQPAEAARVVNAIALDRVSLWSALALSSLLNVFLLVISRMLFPLPEEVLPILNTTPVALAVIYFSIMVGFVFAFFWAGRAMGGRAEMSTILAMMSWLQIMRAIVQAITLVLMVALPGLAGIFVLGAGFYGVYVSMNFVNEAQGFGSLAKFIET